MIKYLWWFDVHMPFAGHVGIIAQALHLFAPQLATASKSIQLSFQRIGSPQKFSSIEHGAGGHTHGTMPPSHIVGSGKDRSPARKFVQGGRIYLLISQLPDGVIALIVGEDKEDIGCLLFTAA